jgi:hypothetical protein
MNRSIRIAASVLAMAGFLSTTARADQKPGPQETQEARSTVMGHRVVSITPQWVEESNGKRTRHLVGVEIRIEAERGMTAEYLTVELRHHLSSTDTPHSMLEPVFGVEGSNVEVRSTGDGFVFRVTAPDTKRAEDIVRLSRLLG